MDPHEAERNGWEISSEVIKHVGIVQHWNSHLAVLEHFEGAFANFIRTYQDPRPRDRIALVQDVAMQAFNVAYCDFLDYMAADTVASYRAAAENKPTPARRRIIPFGLTTSKAAKAYMHLERVAGQYTASAAGLHVLTSTFDEKHPFYSSMMLVRETFRRDGVRLRSLASSLSIELLADHPIMYSVVEERLGKAQSIVNDMSSGEFGEMFDSDQP